MIKIMAGPWLTFCKVQCNGKRGARFKSKLPPSNRDFGQVIEVASLSLSFFMGCWVTLMAVLVK